MTTHAWRPFPPASTSQAAPPLAGRVRALLLTLLCIAIWPPALDAADLTPVRLQLKWYHQFQFAGYYAAEAKGYYRDAGLDVKIIEGTADVAPDRMVLDRQAEFGIQDGNALLLGYLQGQPLTSLAVIFQNSPTVLLSYTGARINNPADLIGRTVAIGQAAAQLLALMRREGITVKSTNDSPIIHFIPTTGSIKDLEQANVVAMSAYTSDVPRFRREAKQTLAVMRPHDYGVDFYGDVLFSRQDYAQSHAETVRRFRQASLKGWAYALEHPEELISLIEALPSQRTQRPDRLGLQEEAAATADLIRPRLIELGNQNPQRWELMAKNYADLGFISAVRPLDDFIFSPEIHQRFVRQQTLVLLVVLAALSLALVLGLIWLRLLRRQVALRTAQLDADIAERHGIETALRTNEARFTMILEHIDTCVYMKDRSGHYLFANRACRERWLNAGNAEVIGQTDATLLDPTSAESIRNNDRRALELGKAHRIEESVQTLASAKTRRFRTTRLPLRDSADEICGLCGIASEIGADAPNPLREDT